MNATKNSKLNVPKNPEGIKIGTNAYNVHDILTWRKFSTGGKWIDVVKLKYSCSDDLMASHICNITLKLWSMSSLSQSYILYHDGPICIGGEGGEISLISWDIFGGNYE